MLYHQLGYMQPCLEQPVGYVHEFHFGFNLKKVTNITIVINQKQMKICNCESYWQNKLEHFIPSIEIPKGSSPGREFFYLYIKNKIKL